jgi:hypothetical protein
MEVAVWRSHARKASCRAEHEDAEHLTMPLVSTSPSSCSIFCLKGERHTQYPSSLPFCLWTEPVPP